MLTVLKKQLKKNSRRGFTLVEVIVVLVILAILAAIAIPALTGYIDKANEKAALSEARTIAVALQTIISEEYGNGNSANIRDKSSLDWKSKITSSSAVETLCQRVNKLSGANISTGAVTLISVSGTALHTFAYEKDASKYAGYNHDRSPQYKLATSPALSIKK